MPKSQINLLPKEEFEKKPLGKFLIWALTVGRWIVVFTELIVILAFLSRFKFDRDISDLHDRIKQKTAVVQSYSSFEKDFRLFQKRILTIKTLTNKKIGATSILSIVSGITPPDVALTSFSINSESGDSENYTLTISGISLSEEGLGSFLAGLSASGSFTDINLGSIAQKAEEPGMYFSVSAKIKLGGEKNAA